MANLVRKQQKIFAENSQSTQVTAFRTAGGTPLYSKDVDEIQNANFSVGWLEEDNAGNVTPYAEDMNGVFYAFTRNLAYLYQKGIPEWLNSETYYENAMCMYEGVLYQSLVDENTNRQPDTQTSYWQPYASPVSGSVTGVDNLGTGAGISTGVSNTRIQLKSLVAGTNVTLTEGEDSITIDSTGGGGTSSVAWGDITGSIASQVDLATALSQRGTLAGNNTWTGTNTVRDLIPSSDSTYSLGASNYSWRTLFTNYIFSNSNDHLVIGNTSNNNRVLINYTMSGGSWGIFPDTDSGTTSYLGNSYYKWDEGYVSKIQTDEITSAQAYITISKNPIPPSTGGSLGSATNKWTAGWYSSCTIGSSGINPVGTVTLGNGSNYWNNLYTNGIALNGNVTVSNDNVNSIGTHSLRLGVVYSRNFFLNQNNGIYADENTGKFMVQWHSDSANANRTVLFSNDSLIPFTSTQIDLGGTSNYWRYTYTANLNTGDIYGVNGDIALHNGLVPSGNVSLGWTTNRYTQVCTKNLAFSSTNYFYQEDSTGNTFFQWRNASDSQNRTIFFADNHILPFNSDITLGSDYFKWQLVYSTGGVTGSDRDIKRNIESLEDASEKLNQLNIVSYMTKAKDSEIMYGVIAQEAEKVAPELVRVPEGYKEGDGSLGVYTNNILFLAVKAIQELSAKVDDLQQQLREIKQ